MKLIAVEPRDHYIIRVYLDNDSTIDFDVKAEIARIPCYNSLYNNELFKQVSFKNKRIFWNKQYDFHLDQILERGHLVNADVNDITQNTEIKI
ncbi:MAG: DUF2442 domain-containing protein [Methylococcaceae bacterium]|jgi:hypothetical protein|nr:DUF2442 domain-containing protein [Methylovulum sp.]